jgi:rod shape-determining protein MreB
MLDAVLGLLSQDLALDLGSSRTRVHLRGTGVVLDLPSVVTIRTHRSGRKEVTAVGDEAEAMIGRTPRDMDAVRPVRAGRIVAFEAADALLLHIVQAIHGRTGWVRPRMVVAVGQDAPELVHRAVRDSCERVGAREVHLVSKPLAAALGCGLDLESPAGHMIVDIGAGTTQVAVLCMNEVVASTTLEIGGDVFDGAILRHLLRQHALLVGQPSAARVKHAIGAALEPEAGARLAVAGRCMRQGVPRMVQLTAPEVSECLSEPIAAIAAGIRRVLEQTPPEVASDVVDHGVILTGGGSQLRNLDIALRAGTGLAILPAGVVDHAVIGGAGVALEQMRVLERVAC